MAYAENDQIADFSLVQYVGTEPNPTKDVKKARFVYNDAELGFYEYVRVAVSGGKMSFNPIYELKATMKTLCNDLNDRAQYVDLDIKDGISVRSSRPPAGQHLRLRRQGVGGVFHAVARRAHQGGVRAVLQGHGGDDRSVGPPRSAHRL